MAKKKDKEIKLGEDYRVTPSDGAGLWRPVYKYGDSYLCVRLGVSTLITSMFTADRLVPKPKTVTINIIIFKSQQGDLKVASYIDKKEMKKDIEVNSLWCGCWYGCTILKAFTQEVEID
jgi:hypothetical protein